MRRLTAASLVGGLLLAAAPMFVTSASALTSTATIKKNAPNGVSLTDRQFRHTFCPVAPPTQDLDAHIFDLGSIGEGASVTVTAPSNVPHDLGAYVYSFDATAGTCVLSYQVATPVSFDLAWTLDSDDGADDRFVVVYSMSGANIPVTLTATAGTPTGQHSNGYIVRQSVGIGATDTDFALSCPNAPTSQGTDGWIFALNAGLVGTATSVSITADAAQAHDFIVFVYNSDCSFDRTLDNAGSFDITDTPDSDDAFYSVITTTGAGVAVQFDAA